MKCENCTKIQECDDSGCDYGDTCPSFELKGKIPLKPAKSKALCEGCYNDFYNKERGGCWNYDGVELALVSIIPDVTTPPPYKVEWRLRCFRLERK